MSWLSLSLMGAKLNIESVTLGSWWIAQVPAKLMMMV
jgi:hypothetical protein